MGQQELGGSDFSATLSGRGRMHEPTGMGRELLAPYQEGNVFVGVGVSAWCNR
jgi:hypothetical protein